ncbi:hypothetical protein [Planococcus versutus]|uniref:hypothetical protein n=1 Tax=Planococcus versutus TaxID=1302659 RepID=UPI0012FFC4C8|nr:hypothetical protein [Planococcus versutus]
MKVIRFMDDVVGTIFDGFKLVVYFVVGAFSVSMIMYGITGLFNVITDLFY